MQPGADAGEDLQVDLAGVQLVLQEHEKLLEDEKLLHRPGDPVWLVDDQGVAGLERAKRRGELRPGPAGARGLDDHFPAVRRRQGLELHLVVLGTAGDPGLADPDGVGMNDRGVWGGVHPPIVPETVPELRVEARFRDGSRDTLTWAFPEAGRPSRIRPIPGRREGWSLTGGGWQWEPRHNRWFSAMIVVMP